MRFVLDKLDYDERVYEEAPRRCDCECQSPDGDGDPDGSECSCHREPDYEAIIKDRDAYDPAFDPAYKEAL